MAATVVVRMRENTFQKKFSRYVRQEPNDSDLKRKAYTAAAAKMARVVYGLVKHGQNYRSYFEDAVVPGGRTRSLGPWRETDVAHSSAVAAITS